MRTPQTAITIKRVDFDTEKANTSTEQNLKVQKQTDVYKINVFKVKQVFKSPHCMLDTNLKKRKKNLYRTLKRLT